MRLKIKSLKFSAGRPVAILNQDTAEKLNTHIDNRILIKKVAKKEIITKITSKNFLSYKKLKKKNILK